jgi:hypothetical protein
VVNRRGVEQVFTPAVWKVHIPSRVHIFLWLLANNKVLTRENLAKRRPVDDTSCLFCSEFETVTHLFFDCCVAKVFWKVMSEVIGLELGTDFESVARLWISEKRHKIVNVCTSAALWAIWKLRNKFCFQGMRWTGVQVLLRCSRMLRDWRLINRREDTEKLEELAAELERQSYLPPRLCWTAAHQAQEGSVESAADVALMARGMSVLGTNESNGNIVFEHVIDAEVEPELEPGHVPDTLYAGLVL